MPGVSVFLDHWLLVIHAFEKKDQFATYLASTFHLTIVAAGSNTDIPQNTLHGKTLFFQFFFQRDDDGDYSPSSCVREERRGCPGSDPTELSQTRDRHSVVSCHSSTFQPLEEGYKQKQRRRSSLLFGGTELIQVRRRHTSYCAVCTRTI